MADVPVPRLPRGPAVRSGGCDVRDGSRRTTPPARRTSHSPPATRRAGSTASTWPPSGATPWCPGTAPAPHQMLAEWADEPGASRRRPHRPGRRLRSGRDAEYLAGLGYDTVAFDISASAIQAAGRRHPDTTVRYLVADLLDPPPSWLGSFDLVVESMNVQALPDPPRRAGDRQRRADGRRRAARSSSSTSGRDDGRRVRSRGRPGRWTGPRSRPSPSKTSDRYASRTSTKPVSPDHTGGGPSSTARPRVGSRRRPGRPLSHPAGPVATPPDVYAVGRRPGRPGPGRPSLPVMSADRLTPAAPVRPWPVSDLPVGRRRRGGLDRHGRAGVRAGDRGGDAEPRSGPGRPSQVSQPPNFTEFERGEQVRREQVWTTGRGCDAGRVRPI